MGGGGATASAPGSSAAAFAALERELAAVKGELAAAQRSAAGSERDEAVRKLAHLRKEKEAISSIMENKIGTLVDSIALGITASFPIAPSLPQPKWMRELGALDRLVKASILALKTPGPE